MTNSKFLLYVHAIQRIVTLFYAPHKYSYLLTYLLTYMSVNVICCVFCVLRV